MRRLIFLLFMGIIGFLLLRNFVVDSVVITSSSMQPTLNVGGRYFMDKVSYRFGKPRRNDIIAFPSPVDEKTGLVKRVIAAGNEVVEIKNKDVYINGTLFTESFASHSRPNELLAGDNLGPLQVPPGMVFVMGDNRDESEDSRDWKDARTGEHVYFVPVSSILGKIILF
ncbi:MAG: signal peptidase I [Chitinivibrionales bacterium]|nr:signal peptidase I [Chitinivibrionales bacterium]